MLLSTWRPGVSQAAFECSDKIFRTADYVANNDKTFTYCEKLVDLQKANSVNLADHLKANVDGKMEPIAF